MIDDEREAPKIGEVTGKRRKALRSYRRAYGYDGLFVPPSYAADMIGLLFPAPVFTTPVRTSPSWFFDGSLL